MTLRVHRLTSAIGAEVEGIDLSKPLEGAAFDGLRKLLLEHKVLFFRGQHTLTPESQLALAKRFGPIDVHAFGRHLEDPPEVGVLDQAAPQHDGANRWHTDSTFMEEPPGPIVLRAVQLPAVGSDTCWASTTAAWAALAPPIQRLLEGLTATHDVTGPLVRAIAGGHSVGDLESVQAAWPERSHPVVCRHPETGEKILYVNSNFTTRIDQLEEAESEALLRFLFGWIRTPEFQVRFRWSEDAVAIWDNRCTQHYAVSDYRERRIMHRVTVAGGWRPSTA